MWRPAEGPGALVLLRRLRGVPAGPVRAPHGTGGSSLGGREKGERAHPDKRRGRGREMAQFSDIQREGAGQVVAWPPARTYDPPWSAGRVRVGGEEPRPPVSLPGSRRSLLLSPRRRHGRGGSALPPPSRGSRRPHASAGESSLSAVLPVPGGARSPRAVPVPAAAGAARVSASARGSWRLRAARTGLPGTALSPPGNPGGRSACSGPGAHGEPIPEAGIWGPVGPHFALAEPPGRPGRGGQAAGAGTSPCGLVLVQPVRAAATGRRCGSDEEPAGQRARGASGTPGCCVRPLGCHSELLHAG